MPPILMIMIIAPTAIWWCSNSRVTHNLLFAALCYTNPIQQVEWLKTEHLYYCSN